MSGSSDSGPISIVPRWVRLGCKGQPWAVMLYSSLHDKADRSEDGDGGWTIGREVLADELGTSVSTIDRAAKLLTSIGALEVTRNRKGKEWTWSRYFIRTVKPVSPDVNPQPELQVVTSGPGGLTSDDIPENPQQEPPDSSSSLRSEEELNAKEVLNSRARSIVNEYWEWHRTETGGQPAETFMALVSVVKASLTREYGDDEILDAMKQEPWTLTAKRVIKRVGGDRLTRENRPSTAAIPSEVVRAMTDAKPWFTQRWPGLPKDRNWSVMMQDVAHLVRLGYGVGESMIRLAVGMRESRFGEAFWLLNIDVPRFAGGLADYPDSMERAYKNRGWKL